MAPRQQSAVEFISTYSFAIFIIAIITATAMSISLSIGTTPPVYSSCSIQPLITCQQSLLTYNSVGGYFTFVLVFRNNLGFMLQFPTTNAINLTAGTIASGSKSTVSGSCYPTLAAQGSQVVCIVKVNGKTQVKQGANTYTQFHIYYNLICSSCNANALYNATGYSFQSVSPPYNNLYNVTVASSNGVVVINGESYLNNTLVYLSTGTYSLYAQPNVGYHFTSWNVIGSGLSISTNSLANTILTLNSNGNVIARFLHN